VNDYVPPLSHLIHQFKFCDKPELAPILARLMLLNARKTSGLPRPDRLISVPLWQRRHWQRGFNQSDLLCQALAKWLGCAWHPFALKRVRKTATQHQLSARLRARNLKNAFRLELPVKGLHMVIVDDVVTTGSTVAEISRLLLRNGAASVQVWCLCRTL
jgi:ComF family protein